MTALQDNAPDTIGDAADNGFRFLGLRITSLCMAFGVLLVAWGAVFSIGSKSFTSWIPAMLGAPVLISGILGSRFPNQRKLWMHVAVVFGLIAFLGGFRFFAAMGSEAGLFGKPKAAASQLMLLITGGLFTFACVRSFIWARKHREDANP